MYVAALSFLVIVSITVVDVVLRYIFRSPIMWAYDFISWFPMVALFFFAISDSWRTGHHVRVDILVRGLAPRPRAAFNLVGTIAALSLIVLIAITGWGQFVASFNAGERLPGVIEWPLWPAKLMVSLGAALFSLRLLTDLARDLLVLDGANILPTHLRYTVTRRLE